MSLELAELAAGLPFAASFAMAGGISVLREGRRRTALNEAVHELRRPLQAIALAAPDSVERAEAFRSSVRMAAVAVDRLDCEINGRPAPEAGDALPLRQLLEAAVERGRIRASLEDRTINLKWEVGDPCRLGDPVGLARVLDNLISNSLVHGSGEVAVEVKQVGRSIRLVVLNHKRVEPARSRGRARDSRLRISGRRRHGHGLRIVRRVVTREGGNFRLRKHGNRCEARIELPLSGAPR